MISEDRTRKLSIDAAVAKELKLRQIVVWCLWGLIGLAFTLTAWILIKGSTLQDIVKEQVDKADKPEQVAQRLSSDQGFLDATSNKIASKKDMQSAITSMLKKDDEYSQRISKMTVSELESRPGFVGKIADELERNSEFVRRIAKAVPVQEIQKSQSSLEQRLSDAEQLLESVKSDIAQQQRNMVNIKGRQTHLLKSQTSATRNLEQRIYALVQDVEALEREIKATQTESVYLPRNYLLKTNQWNDLTALGMKVKIGRKIGEAISDFTVQKESVVRELKSAVPLGKQFFFDIGTECYRIELTYVVTRFLVKDYVGMEIVPFQGDDCHQDKLKGEHAQEQRPARPSEF